MENYHIIAVLGEGAYGKVFKGRLKHSGHLVAIKKMSKKGKTARELNNLRKEIGVLKKLRHENIILMLDWFETPTEIIVITELAQGELAEILADGPVEEDTLRSIARQLVSAFNYLHHHRIMHRDIKPQNILLGANGVVKLCDFGFARAMSEETNLVNSIKGTPLYMAPELVQGRPYDHLADLWSLGIVLYELATGYTPFSGNHMMHVLTLIARDPVDYPNSFSSGLRSLLEGLLNKNPAKRLGWPHLLNHNFLRQTQEEKASGATSPTSAERQRLEDKILFEQTTVLAGLKLEDGAVHAQNGLTINVEAPVEEPEDEVKEPSSPVNLHILFAREQSRDLEAARDRLRDDKKFRFELKGWLISGVERPEAVQVAASRACLEVVNNLAKIQSCQKPQGEMDLFLHSCLTALSTMICHLALNLNFFSTTLDRKEELLADILNSCNLVATEAFKGAKPGIASDFANGFLQYFRMLRSRTLLRESTLRYMRALLIQAGSNPSISTGFYAVLWKHKVPLDIVKVTEPEDAPLVMKATATLVHPRPTKAEGFPYGDGSKPGVGVGLPELGQELRGMTAEALIASTTLPFLLTSLSNPDAAVAAAAIQILLASVRCNTEVAQFVAHTALPILVEDAKVPWNDKVAGTIVCPQALSLMLLSTLGDTGIRSVLSQLPISYIFQLLRSTNFAIAAAASLLLAQYAAVFPECRETVRFVLSQPASVPALVAVLSHFQSPIVMADLDGSAFGYPENGPLDGPVRLLSQIFRSAPQEVRSSLALTCWRSGVVSALTVSLQCLRTAHSFSLTGLSSALDVIATCITRAVEDQESVQDGLIEALLLMIHDSQLKLILAWPTSHGGGRPTAVLILKQVLSILCIPMLHNVPRVLLAKAQKAFHNDNTIRHVISAMEYCLEDDLALPLGFIRQLLEHGAFVRQFSEAGGMPLIKSRDLLAPSHNPAVLTETLLIIGALGRSSQHVSYVHEANLYPQMVSLLNHADADVRTACCQAIGQLCTQTFFCGIFSRQGAFGPLLACTRAPVDEVRRASWASIGVVMVQDPSLLCELSAAIASFSIAMEDSSLRVQASAASAMGGFLKCPEALKLITEARVVERLLNAISRLDLEGKQHEYDSLRRHSLTSLCNFAALPEGKTMLLYLKVPELLKQIPHRRDGKAGEHFARLDSLLE